MSLLVSFTQEPEAALEENGRKAARHRGETLVQAGQELQAGWAGDWPPEGSHHGAAFLQPPCKQEVSTSWLGLFFPYNSLIFSAEMPFLGISAFTGQEWS